MKISGFLSCLAWLAAASPAIGAPCFFQGEDAATRVVSRSGEMLVPFPGVMSSTDCVKLRVMSGGVWVYQTTGNGGKIEKTRVTSGSLVRNSSANASDDDGILAVIRELKIVAEGVQRTATGSSRGADEEYFLAAMPTGKVLANAEDLVVQAGLVSSSIANLMITSSKGYVTRFSKVPREVRIPAIALKPDTRFVWHADSQGKTIGGAFDVVAPDIAEQQLRDIEERLGSETDPALKALRKSQLLSEAGYRMEMRKVLASLIANN
jgi:hypothetical protein